MNGKKQKKLNKSINQCSIWTTLCYKILGPERFLRLVKCFWNSFSRWFWKSLPLLPITSGFFLRAIQIFRIFYDFHRKLLSLKAAKFLNISNLGKNAQSEHLILHNIVSLGGYPTKIIDFRLSRCFMQHNLGVQT